MIITRKHLPRRTFLKGIGAAIALPMLDAMAPMGFGSRAFGADAAAAAKRLALIYVPNGIVMNNWTPAAVGKDFEYTRILKPIEKFRQHTTVISGLANYQADALGDGAGDHARAGAAFFTCSHPKKTGGSDIFAGVSVDQVIAQSVGNKTHLPSLEIGLDDNRVVGHCDSGYSCAYTNSLSWKTPTTPLPPEASPRLLFERLFGDFDPSIDAATRARRAMYRRSILDSTREETSRLAGVLGSSDKRKIDEYLTMIRATERRIEQAEKYTRQYDPKIDKPAGIPAEMTDHAKLMFDLQVLAFQADLTRMITFVIGREGSVRTYENIGVPDPHHPLSHHRNNADALEKLTQINTYHMELFAYYLEKLAATSDGQGSLLDSMTLMYGCGHSDSNRHLHNNLPIVLIDKAKAQGGQHVAHQDVPLANLYMKMMSDMSVQAERFGDSTGRLEI